VRVAVYTRASTDEAHQPYSLDAQTTRLNAYIAGQPELAARRHPLRSRQRRHARTARADQALTQARTGRYDLLLAYRVDRLAHPSTGSRRSSTTSTEPELRSAS
jgi:site-specific DNA recombinase